MEIIFLAIIPDPVYQWTIAVMRAATKLSADVEDEDQNFSRSEGLGGVRRQALWFKKLVEDCIGLGAHRHNGLTSLLSNYQFIPVFLM